MTPTQTFDPRDAWDHARRLEVYRYAKELGHADITEDLPKDLMVARLKSRGVKPPTTPLRQIGAHVSARSGDTAPNSHHFDGTQQAPQPETVVMDALAVLERDHQQQKRAPVDGMNITELRQECKQRGIKMVRTDNMVSLKAKLNGQ